MQKKIILALWAAVVVTSGYAVHLYATKCANRTLLQEMTSKPCDCGGCECRH